MTPPPDRPQLYHITHIDNLSSILQDGGLRSDAAMLARGGPAAAIGMGSIKSRRLRLPVKCYPGDRVGDYVPFYFCPRSVMLYLLHRGNHPELNYQGGQAPILHLAADMYEVVDWANEDGRRWAFSLSNAGAVYTEFRNRLDQLDQVNWAAVAATDFRQPQIKEGKQAEFLVRDFFPWHLVERIGVYSTGVYQQTTTILSAGRHRPWLKFAENGIIEHAVSKGETTMIQFTQGDILQAEADALVNTVNCVGVMGRGIALQFKQAFPANFKAYAAACDRGEVQPGRMFVTETGLLSGPRYIINFPTKRHWRGRSRMEDIEAGLAALAQELRQRGIRSVAIPPLGSGLGGLDWAEVRPRIEAALSALPDVDVLIFEPLESASEPTAFRAKDVPKMTPGRASLVGLMDRYLAALLDPFITLLEVHKLMYFLQEAGEPLRLRFVKGPYGPYAENLRHVLVAIEGHLIAGYADGGDVPYKQLALIPGAVQEATAFLRSHADTHARFDRVTQLVDGFETPFGLELLSTVHWVTAHDGAQSLPAAARAVHDWAPGKWQFTDSQIELASQRLQAEGWLRTATPTNPL